MRPVRGKVGSVVPERGEGRDRRYFTRDPEMIGKQIDLLFTN
jgi:hypothetical protein